MLQKCVVATALVSKRKILYQWLCSVWSVDVLKSLKIEPSSICGQTLEKKRQTWFHFGADVFLLLRPCESTLNVLGKNSWWYCDKRGLLVMRLWLFSIFKNITLNSSNSWNDREVGEYTRYYDTHACMKIHQLRSNVSFPIPRYFFNITPVTFLCQGRFASSTTSRSNQANLIYSKMSNIWKDFGRFVSFY